MNIRTINRTIHPDSHDSNNSYRVKIGKRDYYDQVVVNISHDKVGFIRTYIFDREQIKNYESIHFKAKEEDENVSIEWVQNLEFKGS